MIGRYALIIGIKGYPRFEKDNKLVYADEDATEFRDFIQSAQGGKFPPGNVHLLTNDRANRDNIFREIDWFSKRVTSNDLMYVFFSGHGVLDKRDRAYLMPYEGEPEIPESNGVRVDLFLQELQSQLNPAYMIFFIDACHAGAAYTPGAAARGPEDNIVRDFKAAWNGVYPSEHGIRMGFLAAASNQKSNEVEALRHGLFTHFLLEGLKGAAPPDVDGVIKAGALLRYVSDQVDDYARKHGLPPQTPIASPTFDPGFPLSSLRSRAKAADRAGMQDAAVSDVTSASTEVAKKESPCPDGMAFTGGKCTAPSARPTHVCNVGDRADCEAQCGRGQTASCVDLGVMYRDGLGVTRVDVYAVQLFNQACRGGNANGCTHLGFMHHMGRGIAQSAVRAAQLYNQGCDGRDAQGCTYLGVMYRDGVGVEQNEVQATQLLKQGCDGADASGCTILGSMYENSRGIAQDYVRAAQLYKQGCDGGYAYGCTRLGLMYDKGRGIAQDNARAVQLYKQGCDGRDALGCADLGVMYRDGLGVAQDNARAVQLFKQGCDNGEALGCVGLASMYERGRGVAPDPARAAQLFKRGCDGGDATGCGAYGTYLVLGFGVAVDRAHGVDYLRRGCKGGHTWSCDKLREFGESP